MPNHITTEVEIKGKEQAIKKLIKDTKIKLDVDAEDNEFDFNGIIKMPDELHQTTSPTTIVDTQEEADEKNAADRKQAEQHKWPGHTDRYLSKAEADRRQKEYGALNWYDFANAKWGTKWNAYDVRYITHEFNGHESKLVLSLNTAWDTPRGIWSELEDRGFTVNGVLYGEMDGYDTFGDDPHSAFDVYQNVEVDYIG